MCLCVCTCARMCAHVWHAHVYHCVSVKIKGQLERVSYLIPPKGVKRLSLDRHARW